MLSSGGILPRDHLSTWLHGDLLNVKIYTYIWASLPSPFCSMIDTLLAIDSTKPSLSSWLNILGYFFSVAFDPTDKFPYNPHYYTFLLKLYRTV